MIGIHNQLDKVQWDQLDSGVDYSTTHLIVNKLNKILC